MIWIALPARPGDDTRRSRSPYAVLEAADRAMYQVKRQRSAMKTTATVHP